MANRIDLRPLLARPDAMEMLLMARGQLNRAFRAQGVLPPDPLDFTDFADIAEPAEIDDPAAGGVAPARARFGAAFDAWAAEMPLKLAPPVIEVLRNTHAMLLARGDGARAAAIAVEEARDFLLRGIAPKNPPPDPA